MVSARYPPSTIPLPAAATPACIPTCTTQYDNNGAAVMKSYYTRISDMTYAPFCRNTLPLRGCWQALGVATLSAIPGTGAAKHHAGLGHRSKRTGPHYPPRSRTLTGRAKTQQHDLRTQRS
jgi:hypothetical protein